MGVPPRLPLRGRPSGGQGANQFEHIMVLKNIELALTSLLIQQPFLLCSPDSNVALLRDKIDLAEQVVRCLWQFSLSLEINNLAFRLQISLLSAWLVWASPNSPKCLLCGRHRACCSSLWAWTRTGFWAHKCMDQNLDWHPGDPGYVVYSPSNDYFNRLVTAQLLATQIWTSMVYLVIA